jgi:hypothetical protein
MKFSWFRRLGFCRSDTQETLVDNTINPKIEITDSPDMDYTYQTDTLSAHQFAKMVGIEIKPEFEFEDQSTVHTTKSYTFTKLDMSIFTPPDEIENPLDSLYSLSTSLPNDTTFCFPSTEKRKRRRHESQVEKKGRFIVEKQFLTTRRRSRFEIIKEDVSSYPRHMSVDSGIDIQINSL